MDNWQTRTQMLIGKDNIEKLQKAHVAVFGLGGVGGFAVEALARAGVSYLTLIDNDVVNVSNLNRQIIALIDTIGMQKTEAAKKRVLSINPNAQVMTHPIFYSKETATKIDISSFDYCIDAIDTVTSKIELIANAKATQTKIISCMGTGNKLDPSRLKLTDLSKTTVCPLARVMRHELKKLGITELRVVFSDEPPKKPAYDNTTQSLRPVPASISFLPSVAGLLLASEVINSLIKT